MTTTTFKIKTISKMFAAAALLSVGTSGFAATWDILTCANGTISSGCTANSGISLSASGYSTGAGTVSASSITTNFTNTATIQNYGASYGVGLLASNDQTTTGPHAFDNVNGVDALLLNFGNKVSLSAVNIGWSGTTSCAPSSSGCTAYGDSDFSVFAWLGATAAPTLTNVGPSGLVSSGWKLVGNYADLVANASATLPTGNAALYSSYWLISAFDSSYLPAGTTSSTLTGGNDSFKLLSVAGATCAAGSTVGTSGSSNGLCTRNQGSQVPEPGSLALFGAAMIGFVASRRRKAATV